RPPLTSSQQSGCHATSAPKNEFGPRALTWKPSRFVGQSGFGAGAATGGSGSGSGSGAGAGFAVSTGSSGIVSAPAVIAKTTRRLRCHGSSHWLVSSGVLL